MEKVTLTITVRPSVRSLLDKWNNEKRQLENAPFRKYYHSVLKSSLRTIVDAKRSLHFQKETLTGLSDKGIDRLCFSDKRTSLHFLKTHLKLDQKSITQKC